MIADSFMCLAPRLSCCLGLSKSLGGPSSLHAFYDEVRHPLADHHRRDVGVGTDAVGHYGRVHNSQTLVHGPYRTDRRLTKGRWRAAQVRALTWTIGLIASIMVLTVGALVPLAVRAAQG